MVLQIQMEDLDKNCQVKIEQAQRKLQLQIAHIHLNKRILLNQFVNFP
jgi:hypothetical protein